MCRDSIRNHTSNKKYCATRTYYCLDVLKYVHLPYRQGFSRSSSSKTYKRVILALLVDRHPLMKVSWICLPRLPLEIWFIIILWRTVSWIDHGRKFQSFKKHLGSWMSRHFLTTSLDQLGVYQICNDDDDDGHSPGFIASPHKDPKNLGKLSPPISCVNAGKTSFGSGKKHDSHNFCSIIFSDKLSVSSISQIYLHFNLYIYIPLSIVASWP